MQEINSQIASLESQLNGVLLHDLDIREEIYNLKKNLPSFTPAENLSCSMEEGCLNCGS